MVTAMHEKITEPLRRKIQKPVLEEYSLRCAVAFSLKAELQAQVPVTDDAIEDKYMMKIRQDDSNVMCELESAILEKSDRFDCTKDISVLKELVDMHHNAKPIVDKPDSVMTQKMQDIEQGSFNLVTEQIMFDCEAMELYFKRKCDAIEFIKGRQKAWKVKQHSINKGVCDEFFNSICTTVASSKFDELWTQYTKAKDYMKQRYKVHPEAIITITLLNWIAPCTSKHTQVDVHASFAGAVANESDKNVAVVLTPMYTYKDGNLFRVDSGWQIGNRTFYIRQNMPVM